MQLFFAPMGCHTLQNELKGSSEPVLLLPWAEINYVQNTPLHPLLLTLSLTPLLSIWALIDHRKRISQSLYRYSQHHIRHSMLHLSLRLQLLFLLHLSPFKHWVSAHWDVLLDEMHEKVSAKLLCKWGRAYFPCSHSGGQMPRAEI